MRAILLALVIMMIVPIATAETAWVMCQPDSKVNIRHKPSKNSEVVAFGYAGDKITLDGKKKGKWRHCIIPCEYGEGWIREDFISEDEPEDVGTGVFEITDNKVFARFSAGGRVRKTLNKGYKLRVYLLTAVWSVTSQGFIKTKYLMEVTNAV